MQTINAAWAFLLSILAALTACGNPVIKDTETRKLLGKNAQSKRTVMQFMKEMGTRLMHVCPGGKVITRFSHIVGFLSKQLKLISLAQPQ